MQRDSASSPHATALLHFQDDILKFQADLPQSRAMDPVQ
jgi:hypothetical protein